MIRRKKRIADWMTDDLGFRVRVGLTVLETDQYQAHLAAMSLGKRNNAGKFRILHAKHTAALMLSGVTSNGENSEQLQTELPQAVDPTNQDDAQDSDATKTELPWRTRP